MTRITGFSLLIDSQIDLPFFEQSHTSDAPADVTITIGTAPAVLETPSLTTRFFQRSADQFLFRLPGVAAFYVEQGRAITIAPESDDWTLIRLFLLDAALPALLYQRGWGVFWGSCLDTPNGAVLITTLREGVGTSTLAASLIKRGGVLVADGYTAVRLDESGAWALPAFPSQMLWKDSLEQLGLAPDGLTLVRPETPMIERYFVPVAAYTAQPRPIHRIYFLGTKNLAPAERLKGVKVMQNLPSSMYHPSFAHADLMPFLLNIARHAEIYLLHRGRNWNLPELTQRLEESLSS